MKTITEQFKRMVLLALFIFSVNIYAQKETKTSRIFIRVYNMEGKKINKGHFQFINDSVLGIRQSKKLVEVQITDIGYIKTKRSAGHNVLVGSAIGVTTGAIYGVATDSGIFYTEKGFVLGVIGAQGTFFGIVTGAIGGAAIGGITALFKNSSTYLIDGDRANLKLFAESLSK